MMYDECVYVFVCMYRLYSEAAQNFYTVLWTSIHVQCMHQKYFRMTFKKQSIGCIFLKITSQVPCTIAHEFFQKMAQNHPQFLLHFLIHIDVLMLCRKFELIPTSIFQVMATLRNEPNSENFPVL